MTDLNPDFPCPECGTERESASAECDGCGWPHGKPCPVCEQTEGYTWGRIRGASDHRFLPDRATGEHDSFLDSKPLRARRCNACGNIQLYG